MEEQDNYFTKHYCNKCYGEDLLLIGELNSELLVMCLDCGRQQFLIYMEGDEEE